MRRILLSFICTICVGLVGVLQAQAPANDNCAGAFELAVGVDSASATRVDMDTRNATQSSMPASVCSGSWFADDVWGYFSTGDKTPEYGIVVKAEFTGMGTDVPAVGMAVYRSCDNAETAIACFSSDVSDQHTIVVSPNCLEANEDYYVRIWSGGDPTAFAGTLRMIAYENTSFVNEDDEVYFYEGFDEGLGDWTTGNFNATTPEDSMNVWIWSENGNYLNGFGGSFTMFTDEGGCTGTAGFPSTWHQGGRTNDQATLPAGPPYPQQFAWFESPDIDLTETGEVVSITFDQYFRGLNGGQFTNLGAMLIWSNDGGATWSWDGDAGVFIEVNPEGDGENEYTVDLTYNNDSKRFTIPDLGGVPNARVAFIFQGDFYDWAIDNVRIIKVEDNNLALDKVGSAIAPQARTPLSQIEPMYFRASVSNNGGVDQPNTTVTVEVKNEADELVHTESVNIGTVPAVTSGVVADFPTSWTPPLMSQEYSATYTVESDSTDFDESDNDFSFDFAVTTNQFAKVINSPNGWTPAAGNYGEGVPHSWIWGNAFYFPTTLTSEVLSAVDMTFAISQQDTANPVSADALSLTLSTWDDVNGDFIVQSSERELIAFGEYVLTGNELSQLITVRLTDFNTLGEVTSLEGGKMYLAMVDYTGVADAEVLFLLGNADHDFTGMVEKTIDEGAPRFAGAIGIPTDGITQGIDYVVYDPTNTLRDLGLDIAPEVNLNLILEDATEELSDNNQLSLYPNPTSDVLNVKMELEETHGVINLNILDVQGKMIQRKTFFNVQQNTEQLNVSNLAPGTYMLQLVTDDGYKTKRFVVQK